MISLLFIFLAAVFNSFMDAFENENYNESILKGWSKWFYYKRESWQTAKRIFGYKIDGWHIAKSCMIICMALAVVLYQPVVSWWVDVLLIGLVWNSTFWLVYHKIFGIK